MVGVLAESFVIAAPFPFVLLLAIMIVLLSNQTPAFRIAVVVDLANVHLWSR